MALFTAISSSGVSVRDTPASGNWSQLILQNVGTVPIAIYFNATGAGDPVVMLAAGTANDDGLGATLTDSSYTGAVWAKAPAGGGRLLAV